MDFGEGKEKRGKKKKKEGGRKRKEKKKNALIENMVGVFAA